MKMVCTPGRIVRAFAHELHPAGTSMDRRTARSEARRPRVRRDKDPHRPSGATQAPRRRPVTGTRLAG